MRVIGLYDGQSCVGSRHEALQARRGFDIDREIKVHTAFAGRLGRAPELRISKTGKPYVTFSLVVTTGADESQWVNCAAFDDTAEGLAELAAGTSLYVEGTPAVALNVAASLWSRSAKSASAVGRRR